MRVGPSPIAGRGTFASEAIAAGTVIELPEPLNHSCDPVLWWLAPGRYAARRDIAPGTELTYDYATVCDDPDFLLRCHCETYRCRQLVTGDDWRIPQLQRLYAGHWGARLQRRIDSLA